MSVGGDRPPVGFGLVGCGVIAETYVGAFAGLGNARLVAVTDEDRPKAAGFAARHGLEDAGSLEALLGRPDVDAVVVCVPSGLHAQVGLAVARAGRHVVVEKPVDVTLEAAQSLIDGAEMAGVSLHVISQQRYNPGVQRAKALLGAGALGDVLFAHASVPWFRSDAYYSSAGWRATWELDGGGAMMNQAVHYADLMCWLIGPPRVEAARCGALAHDIPVEDLALALLSFDNGAAGLFEASTLAYPGGTATLRVNCRRGTLVIEDGALVELSTGEDGAGALAEGEVGRLGFPGGHRAQLESIADCVLNGGEPPVSGRDGYRALEFVLDVYRVAGWGPYRSG